MDDAYPIEVLHIVNPHVLFVEVKSSDKSVVIEQIGFYGILPVSQTIDIDGEVVFERCENWPAVATSELREFFADHYHSEFYFVPIQDERRSTIFNNNEHKFGDIIIEHKHNMISVTEHLIRMALVQKDESMFHQKLNSGKLKLKLNIVRSEEVLNAIKKYYKEKKKGQDWQTSLKKQTSLLEESKQITYKLTAKNLELLCRGADVNFNVTETIERKTKDLDLCKDADEVSVGRGSKLTKYYISDSLNQQETLKTIEGSPFNILNKMKVYFEANGIKKHTSTCSEYKYESGTDNNLKRTVKSMENAVIDKKNSCDNYSTHSSPINVQSQSHESREKSANLTLPMSYRNDKTHIRSKTDDGTRRSKDSSEHKNKVSESISQTPKQTKKRVNERLIVYGPPMEVSRDLKSLVFTKIPEQDLLANHKKTQPNEPQQIVDKVTYDDYAKEDSNVSLKITNIDRLKKINIGNKQLVSTANEYVKPSNTESPIQNSRLGKFETLETEKRLLNLLSRKNRLQKTIDSSLSSNSDTSVKDTSSSRKEVLNATNDVEESEDIEKIKDKLKREYKPYHFEPEHKVTQPLNIPKLERNVNPYKNLDGSKSVFVDKLVSPVLMVHTKNDNLILPQHSMRDIPFKADIHFMLKKMKITEPNRLQSVSWSYILRGHSVFMIGPAGGGKTLGYVPAVCNLVIDSIRDIESNGPICIIVCATAVSVTDVEDHCKRFLSLDEVVLAGFPGIDMGQFMTSLLNGCHILVCTAAMLYRLLGTDFGVDLRRLQTLVFEDCERLSKVYASEIKVILYHVKDMLRNRADKSIKVQHIAASRQWCDFLTPLARNTPDTIVSIAAFQECVLYSKASTSVKFILKSNKVNAVIDFVKEIDISKRTVIVCRSDDEVDDLESALQQLKRVVFACNSSMTLHDLYNLNVTWDNYQEPVLGPILVCCDGNLTHLNVTNATYLVHFSMPALFSMFCKRFSVLNDNYASIFGTGNDNVKIQILLEETNVEQLPKILNFVKRCTAEVSPKLDEITEQVLAEKDLTKAKSCVPICNSMLTLGDCMDLWNCKERHAILKEYDEPKAWMPKQGIITFKITHYDSAVTYSARLQANTTKSATIKYPNNFSILSLKMGLYFSKEANRNLQGIPKVGDYCAVAVKQNFFERCRVIKILSYSKGKPHDILINLIDEERLEVTKDVYLYYLPDELRAVETHVVQVRLANIQPQDKDVTFSLLARDQLKKITENDDSIYLRGKVVLTIGNCIFVDTLEACQDLSSLGETVVKHDLKKMLLDRHAEPNPQHIPKLKKLSGISEPIDSEGEVVQSPKIERCPKWAHLDKDDFSTVIFASAVDAGTFFVRLEKFHKVVNSLIDDIAKYVEVTQELAQEEIYIGNIVLAQFPDDSTYERARIDKVIGEKEVNCFFVDNGDWRIVSVKNLRPIPDNILYRVPFQAIECRLIGVKPPVDDWTEFGTNWFCDNCFESLDGKMKYLFAKYYTKEVASITDGYKYGIVLVDTMSDNDVVINKKMIELNLAREDVDESKYLDEALVFKSVDEEESLWCGKDETLEVVDNKTIVNKDLIPFQSKDVSNENDASLKTLLFKKPIRSVPLVNESDSECSDKWDINIDKGMMGIFGQPSKSSIKEINENNIDNEEVNEKDNEPCAAIDNKMNSDSENFVVLKSTNIEREVVSKSLPTSEEDEEIQHLPSTQLNESKSDLDSDDIHVSSDQTEALDILRNQLSHEEHIVKSPNNITEIKYEKHDENVVDTIRNYPKIENNANELRNNTLDSDDFSSVTSSSLNNESIENNATETPKEVTNVPDVTDPPRKPKLIWRQNKTSVTLKIQLIGVEEYSLKIKERLIHFSTYHNNTNYEFEIELYGIVNPEKSIHTNKGQYIQVVFPKVLQRNWLNLTKDCTIKKWIAYDVDAIESGSDEEERPNDDVLKALKQDYENVETESEDDFDDDVNFTYKKHLDD